MPKKYLFVGIAEMFATALLKAKPHFSLKKKSDKTIHVTYRNEVGKWNFLSLCLPLWVVHGCRLNQFDFEPCQFSSRGHKKCCLTLMTEII